MQDRDHAWNYSDHKPTDRKILQAPKWDNVTPEMAREAVTKLHKRRVELAKEKSFRQHGTAYRMAADA